MIRYFRVTINSQTRTVIAETAMMAIEFTLADLKIQEQIELLHVESITHEEYHTSIAPLTCQYSQG